MEVCTVRVNNIFHKLNRSLENDKEGIGCPTHILHNTVSYAADVPAVDVETIVDKILTISLYYTTKLKSFKSLCEFVDITYKLIKDYHTRTRWVSFIPALERILNFWEAFKVLLS